MLKFGNFNDWFGNKRSFFGKNYIDYLVNDIRKNNNFTKEEEDIIFYASGKYYSIITLNFIIFIISLKRIYKKGVMELYLTSYNIKLRENFVITSIISIGLMIYLYQMSHRIYYNDLKYIIKKYTYVREEQYKDAMMNKKIIDMYKDDINNLSNSKTNNKN